MYALRKHAHAICRDFFQKKKKVKNSLEKNDFLMFSIQNIDCLYTLEPLRRGGSIEYPQSMFWSRNNKNRFTHVNPSFAI